MTQKIKTFYKISLRRKILLMVVFILSIYTWFIFRFFKKNARFGNEYSEKSNTIIPNSQLPIPNSQLVFDIRFAVNLITKYVPWEDVCRHQAYQAKILFNYYQIPYKISVGFKKNDLGNMEGHAWTTVGNTIITGFCNPEDYFVLKEYH